MNAFITSALQNIIIMTVRPYVRRELLAWGKLYNFVADYRRDWLWATAPEKVIRDKNFGHLMRLDLAKWSDRSNYFLGRWYDLEIQAITAAQARPGDTVVDVGGNRGEFSLVASTVVGPHGKVICVEPNPHCVKALERDIEANGIQNIHIQRGALGERNEEMTLNVPLAHTYYGTYSETAFEGQPTYKLKTDVIRGDDLLAHENPSFVKIDVEGFECRVLRGLKHTIDRCRPVIVTEVVPRNLEACGSSVAEMAAIMKSHGYEGFRLGLKKIEGRHDWCLYEFDINDRDYDAAWIHPEIMAKRASLFENRFERHNP